MRLMKTLLVAVVGLVLASSASAADPGPNQFRKSVVPRECLDRPGEDVMGSDGFMWRCETAKDPDTGRALKAEDVWNPWARVNVKGKEIFVASKAKAERIAGYHVKQDTVTTEKKWINTPVESKEAAVVSKDKESPSLRVWQYSR